MANNPFLYVHTDTSITKISEFLDDTNSIGRYYGKKLQQFLGYEYDGLTNRKRIFDMYTEDDGIATEILVGMDSPLKLGTVLCLPEDGINIEIAAIIGENIINNQRDVKCFLFDQMVDIINDPDYVRSSELEFKNESYSIKYKSQLIQVWVWIRSLGRLVDVSQFITNLNTEHGANGGGFSVSFTPVMDINKGAFVDKKFFEVNTPTTKGKYNEPFFTRYLQQNDIFFIRYEKLNSEKNRFIPNEFYIDTSNLPNQIYDMIGLVDTVNVSYISRVNNVTINVSGRDLSKLLTDDGAYFLPYSLMAGSDQFFVNTDQGNKFHKRLFVSGDYYGLFFYSLRSIRDTLGFIFNQLTNVGIIPDGVNLFSSYPQEKISKTYNISTENEKGLAKVEQNGVWQITKLVIDGALDDRRVANSDIVRPDGSLMEQIKKICQDPFVEFWGDTWGDTYTYIARQPPYTKSQINDYLLNYAVLDIDSTMVNDINLGWEQECFSWFEVQPQNAFIGDGNYIAAAHVPIVYLEEYVNVFGVKRLSVPCNYISYNAFRGKEGNVKTNLFRKAVVEDLRYLIEAFACLPFTRSGTITIKGGDRRIKRGMFIRFKPTNEIFYVDKVENFIRVSQSDIDRDTIITVKRGMKEDFINGVMIEGKLYSYFNIVNIDFIRKAIMFENGASFEQFDEGVASDVSRSNVLVNKNVFEFFINRRQMEW